MGGRADAEAFLRAAVVLRLNAADGEQVAPNVVAKRLAPAVGLNRALRLRRLDAIQFVVSEALRPGGVANAGEGPDAGVAGPIRKFEVKPPTV